MPSASAPVGSALRSVTAGLLGLLSVVLLPLALVAFWVAAMVTRTDTFVDTVRPVAGNAAVQRATADGITQAVLKQLTLPDRIAARVEPPVRGAVGAAVASPQFESIWVTSTRDLHRQFVAVMAGGEGATLDGSGRIALSVKIPLPQLAASVGVLGVEVPAGLTPSVSIPIVDADQLGRARTAYDLARVAGIWAPFVVVGLAVLAIALAPRHRRAVGTIAVGWALLAGVFAAVVWLARAPVVSTVSDPAAQSIVDAAYPIVVRGLLIEAGFVIAGAIVTLVVLALLPKDHGRSGLRGHPTS